MGTVLDGRYELMRHLGEGGMGAVYEARHVGTLRRMAVKVIQADEDDDADEFLGRFRREARAGGRIRSPHIAQVFDTGTDSATGARYIAMEYLHGIDVRSLLSFEERLATDLALRIVGQACAGLVKAHEMSIIHRDIKPANLYIATREAAADEGPGLALGGVLVKIVDFGIAKVDDLDDDSSINLTRTGGVIGSPRYMSPEQAQGDSDIDHRTDIWSLGVTLYELLAGRTPTSEEETFGRILLAICSKDVPPIRDLVPSLSPCIADIVHRALSANPDDRYASAGDMLDAIHHQLPEGLGLRTGNFSAGVQRHFDPLLPSRESGFDLGFASTHTSGAVSGATTAPRSTITAVTAVGTSRGTLASFTEGGRPGEKVARGRRLLATAVIAACIAAGGLYQATRMQGESAPDPSTVNAIPPERVAASDPAPSAGAVDHPAASAAVPSASNSAAPAPAATSAAASAEARPPAPPNRNTGAPRATSPPPVGPPRTTSPPAATARAATPPPYDPLKDLGGGI